MKPGEQADLDLSHQHVDVSCRCSTILVRNRDRELYCVACQLFVRSAPADAAPAAQEVAQDIPVPAEPAAGPSIQQQQQQPQPQTPQQMHTQARPLGDAALAQRQGDVKQQLCHTLLDKAAQINERLASVNCAACVELLHSLMTVCDAYAKVQRCL